MNPLNFNDVQFYIEGHLEVFYQRMTTVLSNITLSSLLRNNPYLLNVQNYKSVSKLIRDLIDNLILVQEEKLFGDFLEGLAVFVAEKTCNGHKSAAQGIDLEFINRNTHYIVSIKSGPNWGNSSQHRRLAQDLRDGVTRVRQSRATLNVQPVLGICYGKTRTSYTTDGYLKVVGQNFWYLISENPELYTDIIEPIGYRAKEHNERFIAGRAALENKLTGQFIRDYCDLSGSIDWKRLVQANSMNLDLDSYLPGS